MAKRDLRRFLAVAERAYKLWNSFCKGGDGKFPLSLLPPDKLSGLLKLNVITAMRFSEFSVHQEQTGTKMAIVYDGVPTKYPAAPSYLVFYPAENMFFLVIDSKRIKAELAPQLQAYAISILILKHTGTMVLHAAKFRAARRQIDYLKLTPEEEQEAWWFCYIIRALSSGAAAYRKWRQGREDVSWNL